MTEGTIFILTDTPAIYGTTLYAEEFPSSYAKSVGELLEKMDRIEVAGLVLEVPKVMKASRTERDRLFKYADVFPVIRTKINPQHGYVMHLDSQESFFKNITAAQGKRQRSHERIPVSMTGQFSREDDPSMAEIVDATIHDISPGGCLLKVSNIAVNEHFIHVRIPELESNRPIFSSVRWTRPDEVMNGVTNMGVLFIDLPDEQADKILSLA